GSAPAISSICSDSTSTKERVCTLIAPLFASDGTVTTICVSDCCLNSVTGVLTPLKNSLSTRSSFSPVIVGSSPLSTGLGANAVIDGKVTITSSSVSISKGSVPPVSKVIGPVFASNGTSTTSSFNDWLTNSETSTPSVNTTLSTQFRKLPVMVKGVPGL